MRDNKAVLEKRNKIFESKYFDYPKNVFKKNQVYIYICKIYGYNGVL